MIFSSKNEQGTPKWQHLLSLKVGDLMSTRRVIKPEEKCTTCHFDLEGHQLFERSFTGNNLEFMEKYGKWVKVDPTKPEIKIPCKSFFPSRFAISKTFCVQKKMYQPALCGCGKEEKEHDEKNEKLQRTILVHSHTVSEVRKQSELNRSVQLPCGHEFKPARFEIKSGEWHKNWANLATEIDWANEVILEGFHDRHAWEKWYPTHRINIDETWRVLAKRVQ